MAGNNYHHGDLKSALLTAAREVIAEQGADAVSLRGIAAAAGVSHMAPYAHFKNKQALLQAVAGSGFRGLADQLTNVKDPSLSPRSQVLLYGVEYIEYAIANPKLYRLMINQMHQVIDSNEQAEGNVPTSVSELAEASKQPYVLLRDAFLRESQLNAGAHTPVDKVQVKASAQGAWAMVHGLSLLIIDGHIRIPDGMDTKTYLAMAAVQDRSVTGPS